MIHEITFNASVKTGLYDLLVNQFLELFEFTDSMRVQFVAQ